MRFFVAQLCLHNRERQSILPDMSTTMTSNTDGAYVHEKPVRCTPQGIPLFVPTITTPRLRSKRPISVLVYHILPLFRA